MNFTDDIIEMIEEGVNVNNCTEFIEASRNKTVLKQVMEKYESVGVVLDDDDSDYESGLTNERVSNLKNTIKGVMKKLKNIGDRQFNEIIESGDLSARGLDVARTIRKMVKVI